MRSFLLGRWMYHLTPFTYLTEGFLGPLLHNVEIECAQNEYARFTPPPNQTCQQYTQQHIALAGGYVRDENGLCLLCQYANGDEYVSFLSLLLLLLNISPSSFSMPPPHPLVSPPQFLHVLASPLLLATLIHPYPPAPPNKKKIRKRKKKRKIPALTKISNKLIGGRSQHLLLAQVARLRHLLGLLRLQYRPHLLLQLALPRRPSQDPSILERTQAAKDFGRRRRCVGFWWSRCYDGLKIFFFFSDAGDA